VIVLAIPAAAAAVAHLKIYPIGQLCNTNLYVNNAQMTNPQTRYAQEQFPTYNTWETYTVRLMIFTAAQTAKYYFTVLL
jgi:hypothetical protein